MDPSVTDFIAREARFGAQNYEPLGVVLSRGEGVFVWDTQGHRYLDCLSAYSAVNQGHCHPKILAAMVEQAGRLTLTSRAFHNDQLALFLRRDRGADRLPQGAADEQRCRSGGECDQVGAQMGL
jgi:ornithine--oxo-acid transaminase